LPNSASAMRRASSIFFAGVPDGDESLAFDWLSEWTYRE
jgi:hypothetical protein